MDASDSFGFETENIFPQRTEGGNSPIIAAMEKAIAKLAKRSMISGEQPPRYGGDLSA